VVPSSCQSSPSSECLVKRLTPLTCTSYHTEISSFDVATGRCDRFGEGEYDSR
jgi:hypothetical protein